MEAYLSASALSVCQAEMHSLDWIGRRQKMNRFLPIRPPSDDAA